MAELRPTSNLVVPESLQLDKKALQSNFFYIYRKLYAGPEVVFMTKLWTCSLLPSIGNDSRMGSVRKGIREATKSMMNRTPAGYLSIKKVMGTNPYFRVSVPLFAFNKHSMSGFDEFLTNQLLGEAYAKTPLAPSAANMQDTQEFQERLKDEGDPTIPMSVQIPAQRVISSINGLDARAKVALQSCLEGVRVQTKGGLAVIFADFKITKEEAQQMTSTHWIELRDIDLYPMLLQWVRTGFGAEGLAPFVAFPISRIAATLPKSHSQYARINKDGISISPKGRPIFLPRELNQTLLYEDRYTQAGTRPNGSYALIDIHEGASAMEAGTEVKQKLPPNIPVLIDWVNNKYSYTNTAGFLEVEDLTRFQAADASHIRTLLQERVVTDKLLSQMMALGIPANVHPGAFQVLAKDFDGNIPDNLPKDSNTLDWFSHWANTFEKEEGHLVTFADLSTTGYGPFRAIARYLKAIKEAVLANLDAVYQRYSVHYVMENLAWLVLTVNYASDFADLQAKDRSNRQAALNQKVTPGWVPPSIPLLGKRLVSAGGGMLPHQVKVRNLLKDSPDFAILPVQAGGGKSVLLLTDILYEIKANRNQPYLILCPGHLVANYVKEIVAFTDGKLNVIAINSYAIVQNGFARLKAMLEKAPRNTVVVADYDVLKAKQRSLCYGTTPTTIFPVIDFLRQFGFGYVALDEAHKIKNATARTAATLSLITDIPKKRLASGTMAHDSPSDLAQQIGAIDPTLFGTRDEFNLRYGLEVSGNRVVEWKPGAQQEIMRKIKSRIVVAGAMRKEWAALLPKKTEWIKGVTLTPAQYNVYNDILEGILARIREDAKTNKALQKFLDPEANKEDGDAEDEVKDEDAGEDMANLLKPYLARLEQFMVAPASDILGDKVLQGEDRISPKALMIIERIKLHIAQGYPGKVLVFTNYVESAEEIFRLAGPELQASGILYKASNKDVDGDRFEKDDRVKWMVGVEQSMNEGLNFQFCSRLIRCFPAQTPVLVDHDKSLTIQEVVENESITHVLSYDLKSKKIEKRKILSRFKTPVQPEDTYVNVSVIDNNTGVRSAITSTSVHPFFLKDGTEVNAADLKEGDQLITYGGNFVRHCVDVAGDVVPVASRKSVKCDICDAVLDPTAVLKHRATQHAVDVERYEDVADVRSYNTEQNWKTGVYDAKLEANRAFYKTLEGKAQWAKMSEARWSKEGAHERASKLASKRWKNVEYKERVSAAISEALSTPEAHEMLSANSRANWEDPEYRKKVKANKKPMSFVDRVIRGWKSAEMWSVPEIRERILEGMAITNATEERRNNRSVATTRRHLEDPAYTERAIGAMIKAQGKLPNIPETNVINLGIDNLQYTGDGDYFVSFKMDGVHRVKNPDFISLNHTTSKGRTLRVVEIIGAREYTGRTGDYDKRLVKAYKKIGIECLIIDAEDCVGEKLHDEVRPKLESFINNHYLTVVKVQRNTNKNTIGEFRYDLEVEKNHNFFACTSDNRGGRSGYVPVTPILVHNCETVWNPGTLEQGDSRINRPELKKIEGRAEIFYDWILVNASIDITKMARLISKVIAVAKFENTDNPAYEAIPNVPIIKMSLENVQTMNSWAETLGDYNDAYKDYRDTRDDEYKAYMQTYRDSHNGEDPKLNPLTTTENPSDAKLMSRVPYPPGLDIYGAGQSGLVRLDEYLNKPEVQGEGEEEGDEEAEDEEEGAETPEQLKLRALYQSMKGKVVHTEFGEGVIHSIGKGKLIAVDLFSGFTARIRKSAVFVVTRTETSTKDIRNELLKKIGDLPIDAPVDVPANKWQPSSRALKLAQERNKKVVIKKELKKQKELVESLNAELQFIIANGFLGISYFVNGENDPVSRALQAVGFRPNPQFYYAQVMNAKKLKNQLDLWEEKGFRPDPSIMKVGARPAFAELYSLLKAGKVANHADTFKMTSAVNVRNFYRMEHRASNDKLLFKPYPLIEDDVAYIVLPIQGQTASKAAIKVKAPGFVWHISPDTLSFFGSKQQLKTKLAQIMEAGITISNMEDLKVENARLKTMKVRSDETIKKDLGI